MQATPRIRTAESVLRALELEPMPALHRWLIGGLLLLAVALPAIWLKPYWGLPWRELRAHFIEVRAAGQAADGATQAPAAEARSER